MQVPELIPDVLLHIINQFPRLERFRYRGINKHIAKNIPKPIDPALFLFNGIYHHQFTEDPPSLILEDRANELLTYLSVLYYDPTKSKLAVLGYSAVFDLACRTNVINNFDILIKCYFCFHRLIYDTRRDDPDELKVRYRGIIKTIFSYIFRTMYIKEVNDLVDVWLERPLALQHIDQEDFSEFPVVKDTNEWLDIVMSMNTEILHRLRR